MDQEQQVNAKVTSWEGSIAITGKARAITRESVTISSPDYILPGTKVDTLLYFDQPRTVRGRVAWSLAEFGADTMVYQMGISVESSAAP